jgi:hypothetical protein
MRTARGRGVGQALFAKVVDEGVRIRAADELNGASQ